jgi:hypothetical protein
MLRAYDCRLPLTGTSMSADFKNNDPQVIEEINVNDASQIRYWTQRWDVSEAELRKAVADVGTEVDEIRIALGK